MNKMTLVVRMYGGGGNAEAMLKRAVASVDPEQPISQVNEANELLSGGLRLRRFITVLLSTFAVLGLVLAMTGVAGVVSYSVARRSREIGIRLAIGARPVQALAIIIKQSMFPACAGILIGCVFAWSVTRLLAGMLFGVNAHDPEVFLEAVGALGGAALLACLIPARRALTVNAVEILRAE
jgi:ABC-type antimicrobial peptide transport system permease subunit